MGLINIVIYISFFIFGSTSTLILLSIRDRVESNKKSSLINNIFIEVLGSISKSKFVTRVNNTVTINSSLSIGNISIVYMIDRVDIVIFKDNKILYTSESIDEELLAKVIDAIMLKHGKYINDTVTIFGFLFSKVDFEKKFKMKIENGVLYPIENNDSDVDRIKKNNLIKFSIDDILDKINDIGFDKLTIEEKDFLKSYKN